MSEVVTLSIFLPTMGVVFSLFAFLWNESEKAHRVIDEKFCDYDKINAHIAEIRNDIRWIKDLYNTKNLEK